MTDLFGEDGLPRATVPTKDTRAVICPLCKHACRTQRERERGIHDDCEDSAEWDE